jgi:hypothetical protein
VDDATRVNIGDGIYEMKHELLGSSDGHYSRIEQADMKRSEGKFSKTRSPVCSDVL